MATVGAIDVVLRTNTRPATLAFEASSRSITKFERNAQRDLARFNRNSTVAMTAAAKSTERARAALLGVRNAMGLLGGAITIRGFTQLLDSSTRIENSLKVAGLAGDELRAVYDRLYASAQKNAAPLESLVDLYSRVSLVQGELGVSSEQLLGFTDNIAVALRVSGKSASEASGALLQLSQALGSGVVRAEEFNSILEGALPIAQAAAAGLDEAGGSVSKLRQLVVDGKVSSAAFFAAFEAGSVTLREKVAGAELTVSQSFIRLQNVLTDAVGKFDGATGASSAAAEGIESLAQSVEQLGDFVRANQPAISSFIGILEGDWLEAVRKFRQDVGIADVVDPMIAAAFAVRGSAADIEASIHRVLTAASGVADPVGLDAILERLVAGEIDAGQLQQALIDLGGTRIDFGAVHELSGLIGQLRTARAEAQALATSLATPQGPQGRGRPPGAPRPETPDSVKPVSLDDYEVPTKPGSGGGSGKSPGERFGSTEDQFQKRLEQMKLETNLLGKTTFEMERQRAAFDLLSAAKSAELPITDELTASINVLATEYANAQLGLEGALLTMDNRSPWETMGEEIRNLDDLMAAGAISAETYAAQMGRAAETMAAGYASAASGILGQVEKLTDALGLQGKEAFEVQKAISIANAIVAGGEAVVKSYNWGTTLGGPIGGALAAGLALAATTAQVAAIASTSYNSKSLSGAGTSGGGAAAAVPEAASAQKSFNITLMGKSYGKEEIRDLLEQIGDVMGDGYVMRVST